MNFRASDIARSAAIYPHSFDDDGGRVLLVPLSEADYRVASFLDRRLLVPGMAASWVQTAQLTSAAHDVRPLPLHYIFHSGHVGSTLLSRLLDEIPGVLGLREPSPLRRIADALDAPEPSARWERRTVDARLDAFLLLWARGFSETRAVILKATSTVGHLAPELMAKTPSARGVYLNLSAESYIAALLAAASGVNDLNAFAKLRAASLAASLQEPVAAETPGELAAVAWLVGRLAQIAAVRAGGSRMLAIDFETLLAAVEETLARIAGHFALDTSADQIAKLAVSPVLSRYSKAPERWGFSPAHRATIMDNARRIHAVEIGKGMALVERAAKLLPSDV